jgi:hypothetical protein
MTSKKRSQAKSTMTLSFQFTVSPVENGYRLMAETRCAPIVLRNVLDSTRGAEFACPRDVTI